MTLTANPASYYSIESSMQGHDGLFARQFPFALSCFSHLETLGVYQRRFHLFAILRVAPVAVVEHDAGLEEAVALYDGLLKKLTRKQE